MMEAAARQLTSMGAPTLLIAVTVLTSMGPEDFAELGLQGSIADHVAKLARLASDAGLDGVVCSAHEAGAIGRSLGKGFLRVTPGIRPATSSMDDQQRIMTPAQAMTAGSTHLVIGRPITAAPNPHQALLEILREVGNY